MCRLVELPPIVTFLYSPDPAPSSFFTDLFDNLKLAVGNATLHLFVNQCLAITTGVISRTTCN